MRPLPRSARFLTSFGVLAAFGAFSVVVALETLTRPTVDAQNFALSARVAVWKSSDNKADLCIDLRSANTRDARQCPERRVLSFDRAPEGRWLRSRTLHIGPEMSLWVRARKNDGSVELGIGVSLEGENRNVRGASWSLDWQEITLERWTQTAPLRLDLPAQPHPELWSAVPGPSYDASRLELGQRAPDFQLPELGRNNSSLLTLSTARRGHEITLLVFWSSWAPLVEDTWSLIDGVASADPGVSAIGINVYELASADAETLASSFAPALLHLVDADGSVARHYRVDGLPEIIVLDAQGAFRSAIRGAAPISIVRQAIEQAR